ncbi:MAG: hypothetical protein FWD33_02720 [Alphaproteobacteria bacterium]|nr:hypothetical protein [Alphaproteobacteria bacterium]
MNDSPSLSSLKLAEAELINAARRYKEDHKTKQANHADLIAERGKATCFKGIANLEAKISKARTLMDEAKEFHNNSLEALGWIRQDLAVLLRDYQMPKAA